MNKAPRQISGPHIHPMTGMIKKNAMPAQKQIMASTMPAQLPWLSTALRMYPPQSWHMGWPGRLGGEDGADL